MDSTLALVILIVTIALVFDFINGFHDAANSVATVVATQVLSPAQAVVWAAFFNFVRLSRRAPSRRRSSICILVKRVGVHVMAP